LEPPWPGQQLGALLQVVANLLIEPQELRPQQL